MKYAPISLLWLSFGLDIVNLKPYEIECIFVVDKVNVSMLKMLDFNFCLQKAHY